VKESEKSETKKRTGDLALSGFGLLTSGFLQNSLVIARTEEDNPGTGPK
jgi:hypothetical protein